MSDSAMGDYAVIRLNAKRKKAAQKKVRASR